MPYFKMLRFVQNLFSAKVFLLAFFLVCSCTHRIASHGCAFLADEIIASVHIKKDTIDDVVSKLGSPTITTSIEEGELDLPILIYANTKSQISALQRPKVTKQEVVILFFDKSAILQEVKRYDTNDIQGDIRQLNTKSLSNEMSFFSYLSNRLNARAQRA